MADSNGAVMTNIWNTEFTNYVNYLKNEGMGSGFNKAFNHTTISVNLEGLRDNWAQFNAAKNALGLLSKFTGLSFTLTTSTNADIRTDNEDPGGAYATSSYSGNTILNSTVNVAKNWVGNWSIGQYGVQTFIHEFGHALGLNHGGPYNGNGDYATDAIFNIDTWQYSIMSYFTQDNYDSASYLYLIGPMIGDIKALNDLYGRLSANAGNTLYGRGETAISGWTDFGRFSQATYCINDTSGIDTMDYSNTATANTIDLRAGYFSDINGYRGNVSISIGTLIENATGGSGSDTIIGNFAANVLNGNAGADALYGYDGFDFLSGGAGNDVLRGGNGNDKLMGGFGADVLDGGANLDTAYYSDSSTGLTVSLANSGANTGIATGDTFIGVENLYGSNFNDTLIGNTLANTIWGAAGNDTIYGNEGYDALNGGAGNDFISGGSGNDVISGGLGADRMYGGAGADTFVFATVTESTVNLAGRDIVYDFSLVQADRIDLRLIDANAFAGGDQAFTFIGSAGFSGVAGQLRVQASGTGTLIVGDVNGDRVADFALTLAGVSALSSTYYLL